MELLSQNLLNQFGEIEINKDGNIISIIEALKNLPRSGKSTRIDKYKLDIPKRSVYDHIISLPMQAEFFIGLSLNKIDASELIPLLVCHDFVEALAGDVPNFTSQDMAGNTFKSEEEKKHNENKASREIIDALTGETKNIYEKVARELEEKESYLYNFFHMIDKTDPIIAIWRYVHLFKDKINIDKFLEAMNDFFIYPETQRSCVNQEVLEIIKILQNKENLRKYYYEGDKLFKVIFLENSVSRDVKKIIERRSMNFIKLPN